MAYRKKNKLYAIIWWVNTDHSDVVELSVFPKEKRHVNSVVKLCWQDYATGKKSKREAKILAIDSDKEKLDAITVTNKGEIREPSNTVFSASVLQEKKDFDNHIKLQKSITKCNKRRVQNKIISKKPIFSTDQKLKRKNENNKYTQPIDIDIKHLKKPSTFLRDSDTVQNVIIHTGAGLGYSSTTTPIHIQNDLKRTSPHIDYIENNAKNKINAVALQNVEVGQAIIPSNTLHTFSPMSHLQQRATYSTDEKSIYQPTYIDLDKKSANTRKHELILDTANTKSNMKFITQTSETNQSPTVTHQNIYYNASTNRYPDQNMLSTSYSESFNTSDIAPVFNNRTSDSHNQTTIPNDYWTVHQGTNMYNNPNIPYTENSYTPLSNELEHTTVSSLGYHQRYSNTKYDNNSNNFVKFLGNSEAGNSTFRRQSTLIDISTSNQKISNPIENHSLPSTIYKESSMEHFQNNENEIYSCSDSSDSDNLDLFTDFKNVTIENVVQKIATILPMKITKQHIEVGELFLSAMKYNYNLENMANYESKANYSIPLKYYEPGEDMEEISPGCGFFLFKTTILFINESSKIYTTNKAVRYKWKIIVRETLLQIYGNALANYSATGKRSKKWAIDRKLFYGLYQWCNRVAEEAITTKEYIKYLNKCMCNKRNYKQKLKDNINHHN